MKKTIYVTAENILENPIIQNYFITRFKYEGKIVELETELLLYGLSNGRTIDAICDFVKSSKAIDLYLEIGLLRKELSEMDHYEMYVWNKIQAYRCTTNYKKRLINKGEVLWMRK